MKLLIITQTVDSEDPVLGFFVRWIEEFARAQRSLGEVGKRAEHIEVICLRSGRSDLPKNVRVHSLGKESGASKVKYVWNFYKYIWLTRSEYDAVFVHMNPEYVVLGGPLWRLLKKHISLWYTHKSVDLKLRIAEMFVHHVFTASKESFRLPSTKVRVMGHGIDTDFFSPDAMVARGNWLLSVGRLMPSKRHDLAIRAAVEDGKELRIAGDGLERQNLEALARKLDAHVQFLGARTQLQLRDEYRRAAYLVHTSETGSLDKVVLEALACGLPVVTTAATLADLPVTVVHPTPQAIAEAVRTAGHADGERLAAFVREHHSLQKLVPALLSSLDETRGASPGVIFQV